MAFNLNKNEAANSTTKFDLSKSNPSAAPAAQQTIGKSKTWLYVLPILLLAGIAVWYFLSDSGKPGNTTETASNAPSSSTTNDPVRNDSIGPSDAKMTPAGKAENAGTADSSKTGKGNQINTFNKNPNKDAVTYSPSLLNGQVPATFAKGSNSFSNMDQTLVKNILNFLEKNPGSVVTVNGYASSEGEVAINQKISEGRANAFKTYLISKGITSDRIKTNGKGIENPISSNDTEKGRIKNRRVEIVFQ